MSSALLVGGVGEAEQGVMCAGRLATIVGTAQADHIVGTSAADVIAGLGGDDVIEGLQGADIVCGGDGDDVIVGGRGRDRLYGQAGDDTLRGNRQGDILVGGRGADLLVGGIGPDTLVGGSQDDDLRGGSGEDHLEGGRGFDTLHGGVQIDRCIDGEYLRKCEGDFSEIIVGRWQGRATTPPGWQTIGQVSIEFRSDDTYSAEGKFAPAFYYGSDRDFKEKTYGVHGNYPEAQPGDGWITIAWARGSRPKPVTTQLGTLSDIQFSAHANRLRFEFWNTWKCCHGPVVYELRRVAPEE